MGRKAGPAIDNLFNPDSIAVVGASNNFKKMGSRTLKLIKEFGFEGDLYAVNPRGEECFGAYGYKSLKDIPGAVDLCIIAIPANYVLDVIDECIEKEVPVAQILSSGFGETGLDGQNIEQKILQRIEKSDLRLVGPNCIGIHSTEKKITFVSSASSTTGEVSICSQSGGLSIDMLLQAKSRGLHLGKLVSMGNCLDLDPVDFLEYFEQDPGTGVVGLYLEGLERGEMFFETLRKVGSHKPVVILKGGCTELGAESAASHTNSLAGEYATWKSAVLQAGGYIAENVDDFLATMTAVQSHVPRPRGNSAALAGNGGGAMVLATDLLEINGMRLAAISDKTKEATSGIEVLAGSTIGNPTDIPVNALLKSEGKAIGEVINCLLYDPQIDNIILQFNLLPLINYDNRHDIVEGITNALLSLEKYEKTIYVALRSVPEPAIEELRVKILKAAYQAHLPCFNTIHEAINTLTKVYKRNRQSCIVPGDRGSTMIPEKTVEKAKTIISRVKGEGIKLVPQQIGFQLLEMFNIPVPECRLITSSEEVIDKANEIGYPVVLKIDSPDIVHKSDVNGVYVGLKNDGEVFEAYNNILNSVSVSVPGAKINGVLIQSMSSEPAHELICGLKKDAVFGSTILLGSGGVLVELLKDTAIRVPPINKQEAARMWQEIASAPLLTGYRGRGKFDTDALEDFLIRLSDFSRAFPEIAEMDLNPVMVKKEGFGVVVVDCRIIIE